jgi:hypothetical protein
MSFPSFRNFKSTLSTPGSGQKQATPNVIEQPTTELASLWSIHHLPPQGDV